jgi:AraC family transcriptional regulator
MQVVGSDGPASSGGGAPSAAAGVLPPGVFLGAAARRAEVGPLVLAHWTVSCARHIEPHTHAEPHFMLVTSGRFATTAKGESDLPSLLIFNPAGTCHQDHLETGGAFFTVTLPPQRDDAVGGLPDDPVRISSPGPHAVARRMLRELAQWGEDSRLQVECLCHDLIASTARSAVPRAIPEWLGLVREYLDDNFAQPVCLTDLSRACGVHPHHLTRAFRKFYMCTPGDYLRRRRLDMAAQLLSGTDQGIASIAVETGFGDQPHLTRRFTESYGAPPARYRRMTS